MSTARDSVLIDVEEQIFSSVIKPGHAYRKLNRLINFDEIAATLQKTYSHLGQPGIPAVRGLKAMLLQFWEDYSDREKEFEEDIHYFFDNINLHEEKLRQFIGTELHLVKVTV